MGSSQSKKAKKLAQLEHHHYHLRHHQQQQTHHHLHHQPLNGEESILGLSLNGKQVAARSRPRQTRQWQQQQQQSHYHGSRDHLRHSSSPIEDQLYSAYPLGAAAEAAAVVSSSAAASPSHSPSPLRSQRQQQQQRRQQPLPSSRQQRRQRQLFSSRADDDYYDVAPCCRREQMLMAGVQLQQQQQPMQAQRRRRRKLLQSSSLLQMQQQQQPQQQQLRFGKEEKQNPYYIATATTATTSSSSNSNSTTEVGAGEAIPSSISGGGRVGRGESREHDLATMDQMFLHDDEVGFGRDNNNHHHHQSRTTPTNSTITTSQNTTAPISAAPVASSAARQQQQQQQQLISSTNQQQDYYCCEHKTSNHLIVDPFEQMFHQPRFQLGLAYTREQRKEHGLLGLLPPVVQSQDTQVKAVINFIDQCQDELGKYIYLRHLKDYNERLFYRVLTKNVEKLMPLVYTPTVGLGCQKFSEIYMRPRGLFISANESGSIEQVLANWREQDVRVIVVTDGERILGLGDLGANGMGISIGKLSLYTALAGIPPQNVLPITIDVGTNNEQLLQDPFYIGLKQRRIRGEQYEALIDEFMKAVVDKWGRSCLIQFEDFGNATAFNLLKRYRDHYCTFNDDIQGTASVCLSGLISAAKLIGKRLRDCSFLFYGAGEANLGTANLLVMAMVEEGARREEALKSIWLVDSKGLVVRSRTDLSSHKLAYAQEAEQIKDLADIVGQLRPSAIIGASAQGGAFDESICRKMAQFNERPIIFALSNPTSKAECTADQAYRWTDGKCVFASGSPFEPVEFRGKTFITGQGNNAYIFPGVGLAAIAAHVHTIPEETFLVAARALSDQLAPSDTQVGLVYPKLSKIREVTLHVAMRVLEFFYAERLATYRPEPVDKLSFLRGLQFDGSYENGN